MTKFNGNRVRAKKTSRYYWEKTSRAARGGADGEKEEVFWFSYVYFLRSTDRVGNEGGGQSSLLYIVISAVVVGRKS